MINLAPIEVETVSADRDCSFAITLKEPGQPDKTVRRNLRIVPAAEGRPAAPQALTCFISSNSLNRRRDQAGKATDEDDQSEEVSRRRSGIGRVTRSGPRPPDGEQRAGPSG